MEKKARGLSRKEPNRGKFKTKKTQAKTSTKKEGECRKLYGKPSAAGGGV